MSDRIFGALMLLLAAIYTWTARGFDPGFISDPLGPSVFPFILGGVLGGTALYLLLRPDTPAIWPRLKTMVQMVVVVIVMLLYAGLLEKLGFIIATTLTASMIGWRLGASPKTAMLTGIGVSLGIFGLFDMLLELPLPPGLLGGF
jgi:putative tricarboxylic transport membrane protein